MQGYSPYNAPHRNIPRPTSSGTLTDNYEDSNIKRQRPNPPPRPAYVQQYNTQKYPVAPYYAQPFIPANSAIQDNQHWSRQSYYPNHGDFRNKGSNQVSQNNQYASSPSINNQKSSLLGKSNNSDEDTTSSNEEQEDNDSDDNPENLKIQGDDRPLDKQITVPGTSITLVTPDDIENWRKERKKMWLLKISNNKSKHMSDMGIEENELKAQKSVLQESRKQKQFIQSIQNQVNRVNPKSNLNIRIVQREMAQENSKLLKFIKELGDANLLKYDLTQEEKDKLFGANEPHSKDRRPKNHFRNHFSNNEKRNMSRRMGHD